MKNHVDDREQNCVLACFLTFTEQGEEREEGGGWSELGRGRQ